MPLRAFAALLALGLPASAAAQPACVLEGDGDVGHVRVTPARAAPFELSLSGVPVTISLRADDRVDLRTTRGLMLQGTAPGNEVAVGLSREAIVAGGVLTLRPGTPITPARLSRREVSVELADGVRVASVVVPCEALRVGGASSPPEPPSDAPEGGGLVTRGESFSVHASPGGPSLTIEATELRLAEIGRRGGWVEVRRDFFGGSTLRGWVRANAVRVVPEDAFAEIGRGVGVGHGICGTYGAHLYRGPATLSAGATVHYAAGGPMWARADRDVQLARVEYGVGDEWARVTHVGGFEDYEGCALSLDHAYVRASELRFPRGARGVPTSQIGP